jgi:hypothetical protein
MLELHLKEMDGGVDIFVIGEANRSFTGSPKSYILQENWERFSQWHHKIRRIEITTPADPTPWVTEDNDRDELYRGLYDASDTDIIIQSDCDEILRSTALQQMRSLTEVPSFSLRVPNFFFKLNNIQRSYVTSDNKTLKFVVLSMATRFSMLGGKLSHLRKVKLFQGELDLTAAKIWHAGWHFSFCGDDEFIRHKFKNNTWNWLSKYDSESLDLTSINQEWNCEPCCVNDYMPRTIREEPEKWKHWIINGDYRDAREIIKPDLHL